MPDLANLDQALRAEWEKIVSEYAGKLSPEEMTIELGRRAYRMREKAEELAARFPEITPEMITAGLKVISDRGVGAAEEIYTDIMTEILTAALRARAYRLGMSAEGLARQFIKGGE